ncbi:MAG: hypothetical protein JKY94_01055 [Rhodobacteraceae bacterium]|nr:hypothetical protein [Paracoccaceae bacterium]
MTRRDVSLTPTHMTLGRWISISADGTTRMTTGKPKLRPSEIAMKLDIVIPKAVFRKPHLEAKLVIPDEVGSPARIDAETTELMASAVQQATGMRLAISVVGDGK